MFNGFPFDYRAISEIMWKNFVEPGRPQMTILPIATNTHSEYVILLALPLQQWLHKRASTLRFTSLSPLLHMLSTSQYSSLLLHDHEPSRTLFALFLQSLTMSLLSASANIYRCIFPLRTFPCLVPTFE